ncbi:thiamine-phosphate kinase [Ruania suaedae]|uniref:thiamine-phosphate kinase n=1 Tax=Ruania suaedae TaxID=2897774 RepID=UPI001E46AD04|nr:thiamine-phosphate kinase [Ruania suaedae]UFU01988.1 thiamine-phosphate kinase [Ruania suaedae]
MHQVERVQDLTEDELLARVVPRLPAGTGRVVGPGDDAAVVLAPDGRFVVTTDVLVQDRHFRLGWGTGADVGWRAVMQNLADVAAMGARPTAIVTSLVLPGDLEVAWVEDFADGIAQACRRHAVGAEGGDLSGGPVVMVAMTAHGDLDGRAPVRRDGARPGDRLCHAGVLGRAAAGLVVLESGGSHAPGAGDAVGAFLRPQPPVGAGAQAAVAGARAMMDVSDGLLRDAGRMARASGVVLDLSTQALAGDVAALEPLARTFGREAGDWVLTGGEDHGLLAVFGPDGPLPEGFRQIGAVAAGEPGVRVDGRSPSTTTSGWDHFAGR